MPRLEFKGIIVEADKITSEVKRGLAVAWLTSQKLTGLIPPDILESEIDAVMVEIDTQEI